MEYTALNMKKEFSKAKLLSPRSEAPIELPHPMTDNDYGLDNSIVLDTNRKFTKN